jgi:ribosomal protein S18 acetylase RimI-like enzyme
MLRKVEVEIRRFRPEDRDAVRHICFLTGSMGEPAEWMWRDEVSFADVFSGYYTDREPESCFVAVIDRDVVGYLLGCRDTSRAWNPAAIAGRHIVRRGIVFRPGTAGFVWRSVVDIVGDLTRRRVRIADYEFADPAFPAHLHINLLPTARGTGAGGRLVRSWLDDLRDADVPGCFLQTLAENSNAIAFFEAMGFTRRGNPVLAPGERTRDGARTHIQTMVQVLA